MSVIEAAVFGIIQGLTEFLPVSSSGHLVLVNAFFGWGEVLPLWVDIATNTGTLLAVIIFLFRDIRMAFTGFFGGLTSKAGRQTDGWRLAMLVLIGSVPTAIVAIIVRPHFETFNQPIPVAIALVATGFILWFAPKSGPKETPSEITYLDALIAGIMQGVAVFPGLSRSGTTIATLLFRGSSASLAPRMSFLLYLVVSVGVAIFGAREVIEADIALLPLAVMFVTSFAVGYVCLGVLFRILQSGNFRIFAPYLWAVAAATFIWSMF